MYNKILLTDDGSPLARSAVPHAAQFAKAASAEVIVLRVSHADGEDPRHLSIASWSSHLIRPESVDEPSRRVEADPPLSEVTSALLHEGVTAVGELVVKGDDAGAAIVAAGASLRCDLIVMSTHGLSGVRRAVLGSTADHVVRNARVPVLLCR